MLIAEVGTLFICFFVYKTPLYSPAQGVFLSQAHSSPFTGIQAIGNFSIRVYFYVFFITRDYISSP